MPTPDAVCILIPTYNETEIIADVVSDYRGEGFANVLVVSDDSTDRTRELVEGAGTHVVVQSGSGRGQAVRETVEDHIQTPYVLILDGDGTHKATDTTRILDPLTEGYGHVIGDRFAGIRPGAMTRLNRVGNHTVSQTFAPIHGQDFRSILNGYRAFTRKSFLGTTLTSDGFDIETEMAVEYAKHGVETTVVPMAYYPRPSGSDMNLDPICDGGVISLELYRRTKTNNPLFCFGSVGFTSAATGFELALYAAYEWVARSISHEVIVIVSVAGIPFGAQLLVFGVLSDLIFSLHREQMERIEGPE